MELFDYRFQKLQHRNGILNSEVELHVVPQVGHVQPDGSHLFFDVRDFPMSETIVAVVEERFESTTRRLQLN